MRRFAPALLLLGLPSIAPAQVPPPAVEGPQPLLTGRDLFSLEAASDPQISPDGKWIAYVRKSNDIMTDKARPTIWLIDVASGTQQPLVAGPGAHMAPRWSPDGKRLAYVSASDGAPQLHVLWLADRASVKITGLPDSPGAVAWSPDGRRIAYTMQVPGTGATLGKAPEKPEGARWAEPLEVIDKVTYRADGAGYLKPGVSQIFVVSADGGAPRRLTFGKWDDGGPLSWSPDGRTILFSSNRNEDWELNPVNGEVYALDVASGAVKALTSRDGPDGGARYSPDGSKIAYLGYDDSRRGYDNVQLYVMNADGSGFRSLTATLDRSIDNAQWAGNATLYISYDDHGQSRVGRIGLDGRMTPVAQGLAGDSLDRPYTGGGFSVSKAGIVAYSGGDPLSPADIYLADGKDGKRLTRLNSEWLGAKSLAQVRKLPVTAPDGRAIDAWLATPPGHREGQRVPLILEIHGGPFAAYGPYFSTDVQLYAAAGYAVLYTNPRGSTSYGAEFANLIDKKYPGDDYGDLIASVDAAIAAGIADPNNLFVTGGSGGGVLTAWIVGKTNRFKAAATQKPVIDWSSFVLTSDGSNFYSPYWFEKKPWEDPDSYWTRSPLSLVGNVTTPTLVVVGSEDYRTPVSESEQYYTALKLRGIPTALVKVPGASHGGFAARPSQSAAKASAILEWFGRYRTASQP
ncbi:alpha/beta hydrolase family protein [Sphingobium lignivorans]|uniref:Dipeptidyl aminopeptidase/acylaminoacyl peptidase n=1 Tax=Sphingobium lignivorans TaxID=2735886 RepID=A0ABR6NA80_9SPHN|nr:S9 family peptidase [Sphingobium lignivorans]MBB5984181.1 dipeptidyl aminopeptidase/acylaminoacyl peptidase [Sphingobium lignivorans]